MKSNCGKWAWNEYRRDPSRWYFAFSASRYVGKEVSAPNLVRRAAQWLFYILFHVLVYLHLIGLGRGMHFVIIPAETIPPGTREFVPTKAKTRRRWPPLRFEGKVKIHD